MKARPKQREERPARKRKESPAVAGVTSAQKVLAALAEKHDPKPANKT